MVRLLLIVAAWVLITGTTVVRCSSGADSDFDLGDPNRPPVAADGFYQTASTTSVTGRMAATDPDGDALTYRVLSGPSLGSLRNLDSRTGFFTYVPGQTGSDQFSFEASDGRLTSNTATVSILVTLQSAHGGADQRRPPLVDLQADPLDPGALLLLWAPPAARLEKLSGDGRHRELLAADVAALVVYPEVPGRLLVTDTGNAAWISMDGGRRWHPDHTTAPGDRRGDGRAPFPMAGAALGAVAIAPDPFAPEAHLALAAGETGSEIWRSVAATAPWSLLAADLPGPARGGQLLGDARVPGRWLLRIDQEDRALILLSADGGAVWNDVALLRDPGVRLLDCPDAICALSADGHRLWRLDSGAPAP